MFKPNRDEDSDRLMKRIYEAEDAIFDFDEENTTIILTWKGEVSEQSAKKVLTRANKASYLSEKVHWLIDRRQLTSYTPDARIWIKDDFLNKARKELIKKTGKMAAILANDPMAQVSSKVLIELLKKQNPEIEYREFDMISPASNWLKGIDSRKEKEVPKKRGFFSRK